MDINLFLLTMNILVLLLLLFSDFMGVGGGSRGGGSRVIPGLFKEGIRSS